MQVTTVGIIGVGYANGGTGALNRITLRRLAAVWLVSPVLSLAVSYLSAAWLVGLGDPAPLTTAAVIASAAAALLAGRALLRPPAVPAAVPAALLPGEPALAEELRR